MTSGPLPALRSGSAPARPAPVDGAVTRVTRRDLPLLPEGEFDRTIGVVRIVGVLGAAIGSLGALATLTGVLLGVPALAIGAGLMSVLILYALWEDTRLAKALELLRRRRVSDSEAALARIAESARRSPWQRQRARTYLAALAWRRGDVAQALHWVQTRLAVPRPGREDPDERWLAQATEVQLLAMSGRVADAEEALQALRPPPPDERAELIEAQTGLLVAFVADQPDAVRDRLDEWDAMVRQRDGVGTTMALMAWANAGRGVRDRALAFVREVRRRGDQEHLALHYPRLWQWIERHEDGLHYARR